MLDNEKIKVFLLLFPVVSGGGGGQNIMRGSTYNSDNKKGNTTWHIPAIIMEVIINHSYTEAWQGHLTRNFISAHMSSLPRREILFLPTINNISFLLQTNTVSFSYQERLRNLKFYSLQPRRERYIIIYVWKVLDNLVPNLVKPLQFYISDRRRRLCSVSHVRLGHTGTLSVSSFRWI